MALIEILQHIYIKLSNFKVPVLSTGTLTDLKIPPVEVLSQSEVADNKYLNLKCSCLHFS